MSDAPRLSDLAEALGLLSRLPVPHRGGRGAAAAWAWPLAGALLGGLAGLAGSAAALAGAPAAVAAGLILTAGILMTGALHEDGLADSADGLWGGNDIQRRLEIMRDSRIGSYGVLALILGLGLKWAALTELVLRGDAFWAVIASGALSRAAMVAVAARLPHARPDGLSAATGRPDARVERLALLAGLVVAVLCLGLGALTAALAAALAGVAVARLARRRLTGQTGDILGATQQVAEIAILLVLAG